MIYSDWTAISQLTKALDDAREWKDKRRYYDYSIPFHMEEERERIEERVKEALSYLTDDQDE